MIMNLIILIFFSFVYSDTKITPEYGSADDRFGRDVALFSDWIAVGSNRDDTINGSNSGSVYVYKYDDFDIIQEYYIIPPDGESNDYFGKSISVYENWLLVSSIYDNVNGEKSGSAYVYYFNGIDWVLHSKLVPDDGSPFDRFGYSLDIFDNIIAIGSVYDDDLGEDSGSVYVYRLNDNHWYLDQKLLSDDGEEGDFFGVTLSLDTDLLAVGSVYDDDMGLNSGSVSLFRYENEFWVETNKILAFDGGEYNFFGNAVDMHSGNLIVGSFHDNSLYQNSGSVYIYNIQQNHLVQFVDKIIPFDASSNDKFGQSVSIHDNYLSVGSLNDDNGLNSGAVYLYDLNQEFNEIKYIPDDGSQFDEFGGAISIYGNKILVGSQYSENSIGAVYLADFIGCSLSNACNYNIDLWSNESFCEYPINNFECDQNCYDEIDNCGVCGGLGVSGDANYDLSIDILDVVLIIEYILELNVYDVNACTTDISLDEIVNITDLVLLLEIILNQ